jgi:hypothetical protein
LQSYGEKYNLVVEMSKRRGNFSISIEYNKKERRKQIKKSLRSYFSFLPLVLIPITGITLLFITIVISSPNGSIAKRIESVNANLYALFSANPKIVNWSSMSYSVDNPRTAIIRQFFAYHKAPLSEYAEEIVKQADQNSIDWRLIPAIGMCESNGGKNIPEDSFNAWGWAASEKDLAEKSESYNNKSWEHGIARVSKGLATGYYHLIDPSDGIDFDEIWTIMKKYTPPSVAKGGPWARCVWQYYQELTSFKTPTK